MKKKTIGKKFVNKSCSETAMIKRSCKQHMFWNGIRFLNRQKRKFNKFSKEKTKIIFEDFFL